MTTAGSAALSHSPSVVISNTRTARVSQPNGRVISVIGISFITSTNTSAAPVAIPDRNNGRCTRFSIAPGHTQADGGLVDVARHPLQAALDGPVADGEEAREIGDQYGHQRTLQIDSGRGIANNPTSQPCSRLLNPAMGTKMPTASTVPGTA